MGENVMKLPEGFVLDKPETQAAPPSAAPEGFVLDEQPDQNYAAGLADQALQGATMGWADEIQAGIAATVAGAGSPSLVGVDLPMTDEQQAKSDSLRGEFSGKLNDLFRPELMRFDAANQDSGQDPELLGDLSGFAAPNPPVVPLNQPTQAELRREALGSIRDELARFSTNNPKASIAANLVGGVATGGASLAATKALGIGSTGVKGVAATSAALGSTAGAGTAKEGERLKGAAIGGVAGLLAGGTISGIGTGIGALWRKMVPGQQNRMLALVEASGLTPAQIQTRLTALGPKATIADAAKIFEKAGDVAASRLGPTSKFVNELIRRDETQSSRLLEPIWKNIGGVDESIRTVSKLKDLRMNQSSPLYESAFDQGISTTKWMRDLLLRPETQKAWRSTQSIVKSDPNRDPAILANGPDPTFRGWQAITENLWDRASSLDRAGKSKFAGTIKDLRNAILKELDDQSPEYAQARALWAGTKQADDMMEEGAKFLNTSSSDIAERFAKMTDADKAFYRLGAGRAIENKLLGTNDTVDAARMFRNESFRAKAYEIFPDKRSAVDFINTVRAESIKKNTTNAVGRGSQTYGRQVAERQLTGGEIGTGDISRSGIFSRLLSKVGRAREKTIQGLGEALLTQDPAKQTQAIKLMQDKQSGGAAVASAINSAGAAAANISGQRAAKRVQR